MTQGQATFLHENVGSYLGLTLVAAVALLFGLMIWQAAFGQNPVANAMSKAFYSQEQISRQL